MFYLAYAFKQLRRGGQWTFFAVFCVAAGVATVVALRGLGLAITDSLLSNLRHYNHGDINISQARSVGPFAFAFQGESGSERRIYTADQVHRVRDWVAARAGLLSVYTLTSNIRLTPLNALQDPRPQFLSTLFVDLPTFATMNDLRLVEPAGARLDSVFTGGLEVVISQNLAESQGLKLGDLVQVTGTDQPFTVRGIAPVDAEANIENVFAAFFGFAYFDIAHLSVVGLDPNPNTLSVNLPDGSSAEAIDNAAFQLGQMVRYRSLTTTPYLYSRNQEVADLVARFIVAMGLGALLIGGVGIMNTMLVLVSRRTLEIATLKTVGMQGRQIALLFGSEALLLGGIGSAVGVVGGLLLGGAVNQFGEAFLQQKLTLRVYPEALAYGAVLGLLITGVFGVLPVLTAVKVRPALILRPTELKVARAGCGQQLLAGLLLTLVLGGVVGQIIAPVLHYAPNALERLLPPAFIVGSFGVAALLLLLAALTLLLWVVVWLAGHLPAFGWVELHLALRNLSARRWRMAVTLLALTAGMFALSSIAYFGLGAREIVRLQFSQTLGGNVLIMPLVGRQLAQPLIDATIALQPGIQSRTVLGVIVGSLWEVEGKNFTFNGQHYTVPLTMMIRDTNNPNLNSGPLLAGRDLTPADRGQRVIVLSAQSLMQFAIQMRSTARNNPIPDVSLAGLGIGVGSHITIGNAGKTSEVEVVGIVGSPNGLAPNLASAYLPPDLPIIETDYSLTVLEVAPESLNSVLTLLARFPLFLTLDLTFVDSLLSRMINQLAAIPTIVGLLSLFAAAVIMANTVALAVLERRQQMGVLKALGLSAARVLSVLLLENTLVGLLGGLLGIGLSNLLVQSLTALGVGLPLPVSTEGTLITAGLLGAAVLIAWGATLISGYRAAHERVLQVLRYE